MSEWLNTTHGFFIFGIIVLLIGAGMEIGAAMARWKPQRRADADRFLSMLAAPSVGLLALMIGFTFAMALGRFDARRGAVLSEANAIGTASLRGQLLPEPYRSEVTPLFVEYARLRVINTAQTLNSSATQDAIRRTLLLQRRLWQIGSEAAASNPQVVPSGLFLQALNTLIDVHEERLTAGRNQVPPLVFLTLEAIAIVSFGFSGHGLQMTNVHFRQGMWIMALVIGSVIMLVVDLDRPRSGFITVDQTPILDFIAGSQNPAPASVGP